MIRFMTKNDIEDVQRIAHITLSHIYQETIPQELQTAYLSRSYSDLMMRKRLEKTTILVAEEHGQPVGYLSCTPIDEDGDCELTALNVLPSHQQRGYEEKLLRHALDSLTDARQVDVYVDRLDANSHAFFEQQGFRPAETFEEHFEGIPVETVHYVLPLKSLAYL